MEKKYEKEKKSSNGLAFAGSALRTAETVMSRAHQRGSREKWAAQHETAGPRYRGHTRQSKKMIKRDGLH